MPVLTKAAFLSKWAANFLDNVARLITELLMRDFRQDVSDSFLSINDNFLSIDTVDVSGATLTLALGNISGGSVVINRVFKGSAAVGSGKTIAITGVDSHTEFTFIFTLAAAAAITFPSTFKLSDPRWDDVAKTWTPSVSDSGGKFKMRGTYDGSNWQVDMYGPYL